MKYLVAQGMRHRISSPQHDRSFRRCRHAIYMAGNAPDTVEQLRSMPAVCTIGNSPIARGCLSGSDKACEADDVIHPIRVGLIVGLRRSATADVGDLVRKIGAGYAHLVEIRIPGKRDQARMLPFPSEPADTGGAGRRLDDWHLQHLTADLTAGSTALLRGQVDQRLIWHGLDETIAEHTDRQTSRAHGLGLRGVLMDL